VTDPAVAPAAPPLGRVFVVASRPVIEGIVRAASTTVDATARVVNGTLDAVLAALESQPNAIVIVDLDASIERGREVVRNVHRARPRARTIVLSSRGDGALVLDSIRYGAHAFVRAPEDLSRLPEVLRAVAHDPPPPSPGVAPSG